MSETTQSPAWMAALPEDLRSNATLSSFKGEKVEEVLPVLAKSYVEARGLIGKREDEMFPKDDWKPEQTQAWNKRLGVPETPDKYPTVDTGLLEKSGVPKEIVDGAMKRFHELGLTPKQAKGLLHEWYLPTAATGAELQEKQRKEASEKATGEIRQKYGDKFEAKKGLVKSVMALGGGDLADRIESAGFGNDPQMFDALVALGEKIMEDNAGKGGGGDLGPGANAARAQQEIEAIMSARISDRALDGKYADPKSAEYKKWRELHAIAYQKAQS